MPLRIHNRTKVVRLFDDGGDVQKVALVIPLELGVCFTATLARIGNIVLSQGSRRLLELSGEGRQSKTSLPPRLPSLRLSCEASPLTVSDDPLRPISAIPTRLTSSQATRRPPRIPCPTQTGVIHKTTATLQHTTPRDDVNAQHKTPTCSRRPPPSTVRHHLHQEDINRRRRHQDKRKIETHDYWLYLPPRCLEHTAVRTAVHFTPRD